MATVLQRAVGLDLGGSVHDALVAQVCAQHGTPLVTLDRPQHTVALTSGADSTSLFAQTAGLLHSVNRPRPGATAAWNRSLCSDSSHISER